MARHSERDHRGQFTKIDIERDVVAPDAGTPLDFAYGEIRRHAPAGDELAQGGEQHLTGRAPIEIDGIFGGPQAPSFGLPAELFGGRGVVTHDVAHGGEQRAIQHRQADTSMGAKAGAHMAAAAAMEDGGSQDPYVRELVTPPTGPDTRSARRIPGTGGYRLPPLGANDRDAEMRGGR
jgi:hypothetical protein